MKAHYQLVNVQKIKIGDIIYLKGIGRVLFRGSNSKYHLQNISTIFYSHRPGLSTFRTLIAGVYVPVLINIKSPCGIYHIYYLIDGIKYVGFKKHMFKLIFRRTAI